MNNKASFQYLSIVLDWNDMRHVFNSSYLIISFPEYNFVIVLYISECIKNTLFGEPLSTIIHRFPRSIGACSPWILLSESGNVFLHFKRHFRDIHNRVVGLKS